jgi:hypothetical protein
MIEIDKLTAADVGRWVVYRRAGGAKERGKIKGWTRTFVFVVYHCDQHWERFEDFDSIATNPCDLDFGKDQP